MKRSFIIIAALLISTLAGCTSTAPATQAAAPATQAATQAPTQAPTQAATQAATQPASQAPESAPAAAPGTRYTLTNPINVRIATAGSGTSDFADMGVIASFLSQPGILPAGSTVTQETISGGPSGSGYLIEAGLADLCRGQNAISAIYGMDGREPYTKVRALFGAGGLSAAMQVAAPNFVKKTGYTTIEEVIENKYPAIFVSEDKGSTDYTLATYIFDIYGITFDDFRAWGGEIVFTDNNTASEMLQDGTADIMVPNTTLASSMITELTMSTDVTLSGLSDKIINGLLERGFAARDIPAGTFGQFPDGAKTAYIGSSIIVGEDMPVEEAYCLTKVLMENRDELGVQAPTMRDITYQKATDTKITVVPLHEGAIQYFQDIGALDADGKYTGK